MLFLKGLFSLLVVGAIYAMCYWLAKFLAEEKPSIIQDILDNFDSKRPVLDNGTYHRVACVFMVVLVIAYLVLSWFGFWISLVGIFFGIILAIAVPIFVICLLL